MSEAFIHEYAVKILEHHLDAYGHVNNVAYIGFFEQARWDLISGAGCGLEYVRKTGVGPVVLEIQTKFKKELRLRQTMKIKSQMISWRTKIGVLRQWMTDDTGIIYCEAHFTMGMFDLNQRKLVTADATWSKALGLPDGSEDHASNNQG